MSTKSTGLKGMPLFVRVLLLLLLLILMLLLVAYAALRSVPPEVLRRLLGVTTTPPATAVVSATSTPTVPITPSPTSTPLVIVGTVPVEETVTPTSPVTITVTTVPTSTPTTIILVPSPTRPGTATPTLIPLPIVPTSTPTRPPAVAPTTTPTRLRTVTAPSPSPPSVGAEVSIVAEEVSPTATTAVPLPLTPSPTPTAPLPIVPRFVIAEVIHNGDFSGEFLRGGVANEWGVFHNGATTFWCYPDTLRALTGEVLRSQTLHIHGADLPDRYLGIYQTVDVVPGGLYTFTIAGLVRTPQGDVQQTGYGYRMQVGFDPQGGNNWQDVESWIELPWDEQPRDRPSYRVDVFTTSITAHQPQLTVFVRAWKKWADAGEGMYDITRVSLVGPVVTMVPQAPTAIVPPTQPPRITPLAAATPSPLPPGITPAPPTPVVPPTPPPEVTSPAAVSLPTPAVPVTGDTLLTLWDVQRTVITILLVLVLLLGGILYRWRPWTPR